MIIDSNDKILMRGLTATLRNRDPIVEREHNIFDRIKFPGIDRHMMPAIATKSAALRKKEKCEYYPFINTDIPEFERRLVLDKFESVFKEHEPKKKFDFGDRQYIERHNKNTLSQTLFRYMLYDANTITKYDEASDSLLLGIYFRNPPGRQLKKQWKNNWKVLPNLEFWISKFKENPANLENKSFFDLDYVTIGDIHEQSKILYPNDQSAIICTKFLTGEDFKIQYKVLKENLTFGIRSRDDFSQQPDGVIFDQESSELWAIYGNGTRLLCEMQKDYIMRPKPEQQGSAELEEIREDGDDEDDDKKAAEKKKSQDGEEGDEVAEAPAEVVLPDEYDVEQAASFVLTMENGHVLKFLPNGDVMQKKVQSKSCNLLYEDAENPAKETHRVVTGKGTFSLAKLTF